MLTTGFVNLYTSDIEAGLRFYVDLLGFRETFRTPKEGIPEHVELTLNGFGVGLGTVEAARRVHGVDPAPGSPSMVIVVWTNDVDDAFGRLRAAGVPVVQPPHDTGNDNRNALLRDPDGNLVELVAKVGRADRTTAEAPDPVPRVVDHVGFAVADYERSKAFYEQALAPLGVTLLIEFAGAAAGFGRSGRPSFFVEAYGEPVRGRLHVALRAETRAQVDAFHEAALAAGGTDNGAPGVRAAYHPDYYGAYVLDPDGNNVEAVCHRPG